jgi:hypothetical protein
MTTSSRKAKGRNLQKIVRETFRDIGQQFGLVDGDIESRGMGQNGEDVIFSPAAQRVFGKLAIECKNHEALNVVGTFWQHAPKYFPDSTPLLVTKKNRTEPLVTLRLEDFMLILERSCRVSS